MASTGSVWYQRVEVKVKEQDAANGKQVRKTSMKIDLTQTPKKISQKTTMKFNMKGFQGSASGARSRSPRANGLQIVSMKFQQCEAVKSMSKDGPTAQGDSFKNSGTWNQLTADERRAFDDLVAEANRANFAGRKRTAVKISDTVGVTFSAALKDGATTARSVTATVTTTRDRP